MRALYALLVFSALTTQALAEDPEADSKPSRLPISGGNGGFTRVISLDVPSFRGLEPNLRLTYDSSCWTERNWCPAATLPLRDRRHPVPRVGALVPGRAASRPFCAFARSRPRTAGKSQGGMVCDLSTPRLRVCRRNRHTVGTLHQSRTVAATAWTMAGPANSPIAPSPAFEPSASVRVHLPARSSSTPRIARTASPMARDALCEP